MGQLIKKYFRGDTTIWVVFFFLVLVSAVVMYSASSYLAFRAVKHTAPIFSHITFLLAGVVVAFFIHLIPMKIIRVASYLGMALSLLLLLLIPFIGVSANDASRWIDIMGIRFQPSEFAKLSLILVVADLISRIKNKEDEAKYFYYILVVSGVTCFLIMISNLSTALLLGMVIFFMMIIGNISMRRILPPVLILMVIGILGFFVVKQIPYDAMPTVFKRSYTWVNRIDAMILDMSSEESKFEVNDENRQTVNGRIAVARGGVFGVFPGNSVQRDYLPLAFADCIYAIIVEETGLIGGVFVMLLYLVLLFRSGIIANKSTTVYPAVLATGLMLMIVLQALISMAVSVGVGPVTGQPLPLISRGGTSILITCAYFGIIQCICREQNLRKYKKEHPEEIKNDSSQTIPIISLDDM